MSLTKRTPYAQHAMQKPGKFSWGKAILSVLSGAAIAAVIVAVGGVWFFENRLKENSVDLAPETVAGEPAPPPKPLFTSLDESFTMAIIGEDSGDGNSAYGTRDHVLNDVNMVMHVYPGWKQATVMSFPRDLYVDIPECTNEDGSVAYATSAKLNTALTRGGLACAVKTLSSLTGEPIDNALMVGFDGVVALSNAVGGVDVCLTEPIKDRHSGLNLTAGNHTLLGKDALGFLRTRYGVGDGSDLSRISNQQVFLSSLLRKLKSEETLTNPQKIFGLADAVAENTVLSSNLASVSTLGNIAYSLKDLNLSEVNFVQVPTYYTDDFSGVRLKQVDAAELFDLVFSNKVIEVKGGTGPGDVGSVKQEVEETPAAEETPAPTPTGTAQPSTPTPTPEGTSKVDAPDSVTGQNAAESTCSRGYIG